MKRLSCFTILFLLITCMQAQQKNPKQESVIEKALKEIKDFNANERRKDSIDGHPLGSHREEDFLRRYNFYTSIDAKLQRIDKSKLSFDEEINLELLDYDIEDEISSYTFKSYLNPILS